MTKKKTKEQEKSKNKFSLKKTLLDKRGGVVFLYFGFFFLLLIIALVILNVGAIYQNQYRIESILQRDCNSAVEANYDDAYIADGIPALDTAAAVSDCRTFIQDDLPPSPNYVITINEIKAVDSTSIRASTTVKLFFPFNPFALDGIDVPITVRSQTAARK